MKSLTVAVLLLLVVGQAEFAFAAEPSASAQKAFEVRFRERLGAVRPPDVRFSIDPVLTGETVRVSVRVGRATVAAGRTRGLLFGAGLLLKAIRWSRDGYALPDGEYGITPAKSLRTAYLPRYFRNYYMEAPADEICRYLEDLVLDGINTFAFKFDLCAVDMARESLDFVRRFAETSQKMLSVVNALDCDFCEFDCGNQLPEDSPQTFKAEPVRSRSLLGFNACPAKPEALAAMMTLREKQYARLEGQRVGAFLYWPYDEGGCNCTKCRPWGANGYVKLCERLRRFYAGKCPSARHVISTWCFDQADYAGFWDYLSKQDWIDYILCDAHGDFPRYPLEHPIPGRTRLVTFPEISMYGRFPWGGLGAIMMPARFERLFRQVEKIADGFFYYSEGIFEDVNKAVVTSLYLNPKQGVDDILRRYAAYHFAGTDPEDFVRLARHLEANHLGKDITRPRATEARRLAEKMNGAILSSLRQTWRWRLVYCRAVCDDILVSQPNFKAEWIGEHQDAPKPVELQPYIDELVRLYRAERQAEAVRGGKSRGWTCPRM